MGVPPAVVVLGWISCGVGLLSGFYRILSHLPLLCFLRQSATGFVGGGKLPSPYRRGGGIFAILVHNHTKVYKEFTITGGARRSPRVGNGQSRYRPRLVTSILRCKGECPTFLL